MKKYNLEDFIEAFGMEIHSYEISFVHGTDIIDIICRQSLPDQEIGSYIVQSKSSGTKKYWSRFSEIYFGGDSISKKDAYEISLKICWLILQKNE